MYQQYRSPFGQTPPITKNLIIINAIMLFATTFLGDKIDLVRWLGLFYPASDYFHPYQFLSHMFMHGGMMHLFFNMFALWMFGRVLETVWGPKRYLIFYFVTGLGAAAIHMYVNYLEIGPMMKAAEAFINTPSPELFSSFVDKYQSEVKAVGFSLPSVIDFSMAYMDAPTLQGYENEAIQFVEQLVQKKINIPTVGASGAVYGVLLGFGMLFPNTQLMLIFPPIPIKAKWVVMGYGAIELVSGLANASSNIAHFAHLGGMLFGFILIKYWNKKSQNFY
jgi:membrane associated rhomboid family serine protease